ncbi:hypothetical protein D3C72_1253570 [compost metagenome]
MATQDLQRVRQAIILHLVIAGDHHHISFVLHAYLCRTNDMSCGVQRYLYTIDRYGLAVGNALYGNIRAQTAF